MKFSIDLTRPPSAPMPRSEDPAKAAIDVFIAQLHGIKRGVSEAMSKSDRDDAIALIALGFAECCKAVGESHD